MKKWILFIVISIISSVPAFASQGKGVLPTYSFYYVDHGSGKTSSYLSRVLLSNLTSSNVDIELKFYKQDNDNGSANLLYEDDFNGEVFQCDNCQSYDEGDTNDDYSLDITIAPYETVRITIGDAQVTSWVRGYAIIEWTQSSGQNLFTLVGTATSEYKYNGDSERQSFSYAIPINNGLPF